MTTTPPKRPGFYKFTGQYLNDGPEVVTGVYVVQFDGSIVLTTLENAVVSHVEDVDFAGTWEDLPISPP